MRALILFLLMMGMSSTAGANPLLLLCPKPCPVSDGARAFYEGLKLGQLEALSTGVDVLVDEKNEQYYLLSGIKNAIGMPDKDIKAMIVDSIQKGEGVTDFGCLRCESLAALAIQQNKIKPEQETQYIMNCVDMALRSFTLEKPANNTTFAIRKQCLISTCQTGKMIHAAYSLNALSDLQRIHAQMREIMFKYMPQTLYAPCVDDLSVFQNKNPGRIIGKLSTSLGNAAGTIFNQKTLGGGLQMLGALLSTEFEKLEMPVMGCMNRNLALIQKLEADQSLIKEYKTHLNNLNIMRESLNGLCHDPNYLVSR